MDDITFPDLPERIELSEYDSDEEYRNKDKDFQDKSKYPLQLDIQPQAVTESDLNAFKLEELEKKILVNELSDYDMYLKNIHKGFGFVGSTNSLIKLVMAGVGVHKRRREVLKELKAQPRNRTFELNENGELE